jgi:hypothetical protein
MLMASAFLVDPVITFSVNHRKQGLSLTKNNLLPSSSSLPTFRFLATQSPNANENENGDKDDVVGQQLDALLQAGKLGDAMQLLGKHPSLVSLDNRPRWTRLFETIELQTAQAEIVETVNTRRMAEFPETSTIRTDMTMAYQTLKDIGELQVYGAIDSRLPPAAGSHAVRPSLLEQVTSLPMKALTPKPSNALLYAGGAVAVLEGILSLALGINLNLLVLTTISALAADRLLLNGAIVESIYKIVNPGIQTKIQRHEAGHFLCAYLLGCPVEGCVLNAWAALQDARFGVGRQVTAGTSFFDPILSQQMNSGGGLVTRSSIDRYSIIVMSGIAAEAIYYGQADGGAGDEMALIAFLSQLNGPSKNNVPAWNNVSIRNQARWGALQAVLILREYKPCYEALVDALEKGGNLGDCIYAIEKAARDNQLGPLKEPLGYIQELPGDGEKWTTERPNYMEASADGTSVNGFVKSEPGDPKDSLTKLNEYRKEMEEKLRAIEEKLEGIKKG